MNMSRFAPFLGVAALLVIGMAAVMLTGDVVSPPVALESASPAASSTLAIVTNIPIPEIRVPGLMLDATSTAAVAPTAATTTKSQQKKPVPPPSVAKASPASAATTSTPAAAPIATVLPATDVSSGSASLDASAALIRGALVNIICYAPAGGTLHSISGSGVFIDPKGIILTNAHVAQYFLLADLSISCTIRTGSPAAPAYKAALIYISPSWIRANATVLTQSNPVGTGEYDFALLGVTKSATSAPLPSSFSYIPLGRQTPPSKSPVVIGSYGAQFLESTQIQSSLYPTVVFGSIKDIFTFAVNSIDVLALGGSAAAQEGSSGGGVADASGNLIGTITTSTVEGNTDTRSLDAITSTYIHSQYARETGNSLDDLLAAPVADSVAAYASDIPALESIITAQLH